MRHRELPEGESRQGTIKRIGNGTREATGQLEALDGTKKALTTNGMTEEYGR